MNYKERVRADLDQFGPERIHDFCNQPDPQDQEIGILPEHLQRLACLCYHYAGLADDAKQVLRDSSKEDAEDRRQKYWDARAQYNTAYHLFWRQVLALYGLSIKANATFGLRKGWRIVRVDPSSRVHAQCAPI